MTIEDRISNLERSLRLYRLILGVVVTGAVIGGVLMLAREPGFEKVRALEVINEEGKVAAYVGSDAFGQGTLKLYGPEGRTLMALETSLDRSGSLRLNHANEREAFWLISSGGQPRITLYDSTGQETGVLPK
jgi:hypothetical protein